MREARCAETHVRDVDGVKLPVADTEVRLDGVWRPLAERADDGVTPGVLRALAATETTTLAARVRVGEGWVHTALDPAHPHRRRDVDDLDAERALLGLRAELAGRSLGLSAAQAFARAVASLEPDDLAAALDEATLRRLDAFAHERPDLLGPALRRVDVERRRHLAATLADGRAPADLVAALTEPLVTLPVVTAPDDALVPQANSLAHVCAVVDAVAAGCTRAVDVAEALGLSGRQGAYYPHAARLLGLVERVSVEPPHEWDLTEAGRRFAELDEAGRLAYLDEALAANEWIDVLTREGADGLRRRWADEGLGDSTIERRLATVEAWTAFLFDESPTRVERLHATLVTTRGRAPIVRERRLARTPGRVARRPRGAIERAACPHCHMVPAPAAVVCENCDASLAR